MVDPEVDRVLFERLRAGDMSACDECVRLHSPGLKRLAYRLVRDEGEAEDVVQETFLSAFKAIEGFDGRSSLGTWLYRIAYNTALMHLRRRKVELVSVDTPYRTPAGEIVSREFLDWCCLPERELEAEEARQYLRRAIQRMPPKLREVFVRRDVEGLSTRETANSLSISEEAVKTRLHRGRMWLRERLVDYFADSAYRAEG